MKKKYDYFLKQLLTFMCIVLTSTLSYAQTISPTSFSKIVFFGDSLSDNGNLYYYLLGFLPKSPPYYQGRFTNGPAWSEFVDQYYLNKNSVQAVNYAVGGQTAILHNPTGGFLPYTLTMSLDSYLLHTVLRDRSDTLFIIWVGANDYLPGFSNLDQLSTNVIDAIKATIDSLIYHGGKSFLVINLPDLAKTPFAKTTAYEADLKAATTVHNLKLDAAITELQNGHKGINIDLFNSNKLLTDFMENTEYYNNKYNTHVSNTTEPCWKGGYTLANANNKITEETIARQIDNHLHSKMFTNAKTNHLDSGAIAHFIASNPALLESYKVSENENTGLKRCIDPDAYVFWDGVHPSAVLHMMVSKNIIEFIDQHYTPANPGG